MRFNCRSDMSSFARIAAKELVSVSLDSPCFVKKANDIVSRYGIVILKASEQVAMNPLDIKAGSDALFKEYFRLAKEKNVGIGKERGFREFVIKDFGRYDVNMDHLGKTSDIKLTTAERQMVDVKDYITDLISPVMKYILGGENYRWNALGNVISHPGTEAQRWHVDSSHLFQQSVNGFGFESVNSGKEILGPLPCHFVTVFFPLYAFSEQIGPTEVALGSHRITSILRNELVEDQYPQDDIVERILKHTEIKTMLVDCDIGDIVIMDGRTLHRGMANKSAQERSLLYMSFCRPWYREYPASHNESRSLFG